MLTNVEPEYTYFLNNIYNSVCVCLLPIYSGHQVRWTYQPGSHRRKGHIGFLIHLPSAVCALIFFARRIQPFLSLIDREVEFCVLTIQSFSTRWAFFFFFFFREKKSRLPGFELTSNVSEGYDVTSELQGMYVCMYGQHFQQSMNQPEYGCQSCSWSAEQGKYVFPVPVLV